MSPAPVGECGLIPTGMGGFLAINYYGQELNLSIGGKMYKIPGNGRQVIYLAPGIYDFTVNIPGIGSGGWSIEIKEGFCQTKHWAANP